MSMLYDLYPFVHAATMPVLRNLIWQLGACMLDVETIIFTLKIMQDYALMYLRELICPCVTGKSVVPCWHNSVASYARSQYGGEHSCDSVDYVEYSVQPSYTTCLSCSFHMLTKLI